MKNTIGIILSILAGCFIGLFGVLVSVFADSGLTEQLITISIILLIYAVLGGVWGLLLPNYSWRWGLLIGAPGVLFLGVYMLREYKHYYWVYMTLIICFACFSAWGSSSIRNRMKK
jgi:hypothetical protein